MFKQIPLQFKLIQLNLSSIVVSVVDVIEKHSVTDESAEIIVKRDFGHLFEDDEFNRVSIIGMKSFI